MTTPDAIHKFIKYHLSMSRRVWDAIDKISDEQFLMDDAYSRGSIRNFMVHLASVDRRWLTGLKEQPDVGHLKFEDYPTRTAARQVFESVAQDLSEYVKTLTPEELGRDPKDIPASREVLLMHMVNHGTDHRATVLEKLNKLGVTTFSQDFILWLWEK